MPTRPTGTRHHPEEHSLPGFGTLPEQGYDWESWDARQIDEQLGTGHRSHAVRDDKLQAQHRRPHRHRIAPTIDERR